MLRSVTTAHWAKLTHSSLALVPYHSMSHCLHHLDSYHSSSILVCRFVDNRGAADCTACSLLVSFVSLCVVLSVFSFFSLSRVLAHDFPHLEQSVGGTDWIGGWQECLWSS